MDEVWCRTKDKLRLHTASMTGKGGKPAVLAGEGRGEDWIDSEAHSKRFELANNLWLYGGKQSYIGRRIDQFSKSRAVDLALGR